VRRKDRRHERATGRRRGEVGHTLVLGAAPTHEQTALLQLVDDVGHAPARQQDSIGDVSNRKVSLVIERLEDRELARLQPVPLDVPPRTGRDRSVRPGQYYPEFEREISIGHGGGRHLDIKITPDASPNKGPISGPSERATPSGITFFAP